VTNQSAAAPFARYNGQLSELVSSILTGSTIDPVLLAPSLDGECGQKLRQLVPIDYRRRVGAFFTSGSHREAVASALADLPHGPYLDPTCGGGDLLLAATKYLPVGLDLAATVQLWSTRLFGWDLHPEFTRAARLRLLLAAAARHPGTAFNARDELNRSPLPGISVADASLRLRRRQLKDTVILLNPPFGSSPAPVDCRWAEGMTSRAAQFGEAVLNAAGPGCHLVAILPDVLRTGSRYAHWRRMVAQRSYISMIKPLGLFDEHTDIDVFLLVLRPRDMARTSEDPPPVVSSAAWWGVSEISGPKVGDLFSVMVGTVVDNRDPHEGDERPFLIARDLPRRGVVGVPGRTRRFAGRLFTPPFVVLRRTSRPTTNGEVRAPGVLVRGRGSVAIDNHLLVAVPIDGRVDTCRRLLTVLEHEGTTKSLDERIRCRHLTVGAVRELPFSGSQTQAASSSPAFS